MFACDAPLAPGNERRHSPWRRVIAWGGAVGAVALIGCSDDLAPRPLPGLAAGGSGGGAGTAGAPLYQQLDCDLPIVVDYCGGTTCHYEGAQDLGSGLGLWNRETMQMADGIEARLLDLPATYNNVLSPETCPPVPELIVNTADLEQSLILKKLMGTQTCGDEMPKFPAPEWGATNNPGEQRSEFVACIRSWVTLLVQESNQTP